MVLFEGRFRSTRMVFIKCLSFIPCGKDLRGVIHFTIRRRMTETYCIYDTSCS